MKTYSEAQEECDEKNRVLTEELLMFKTILKDYTIRIEGSCIYSIESRLPTWIELINAILFRKCPKQFYVKLNCTNKIIDAMKFTVSKRVNNTKIAMTRCISAPQIDLCPEVLTLEAEQIQRELVRS